MKWFVIISVIIFNVVLLMVKIAQNSREKEQISNQFLENLPPITYQRLAELSGINFPPDSLNWTNEEFSRFLKDKGFQILYFVGDIPSLERLTLSSQFPVAFIADFQVGRGHIFASTSPYIVRKLIASEKKITLEKPDERKELSLPLSWFEYLWNRVGNFSAVLCPQEKEEVLRNLIGREAFQKFREIAGVLNTPMGMGEAKRLALYRLSESFPSWNYPRYILIREILLPSGNIKEAQKEVQSLLALNPNNPYHKLLEALLYAYKGDYASAARWGLEAEKGFKRNGFPDLEGVYLLSFIFNQAGLQKESRAIFDWALKSSPQKRELLILRAFYNFENKLYDEGIRDVKEALSFPQKTIFPLWKSLLIEAYYLKGDMKKCRDTAIEIDKIAPQAKESLWVKALELQRGKRGKELLQLLEKEYRAEDKNSSNYIVSKASALLAIEDAHKAKLFLENQPLLQEALKERNKELAFLPLLSIYGTTLYESNELDKARDILYLAYKRVHLDKGIRWFLGPSEISWFVNAEYYLGLTLLKQGKEKEALCFLKEALGWRIPFPERGNAIKLFESIRKQSR